MEQENNTFIQELKDVARHVVPAGGQVWLYGSRARGDFRNSSDWDLLILVDKDHISPADEDDISYPFVKRGWTFATAVTPLLYTYSEWEQRHCSPFYQNVEKDKIQIL